MEEDAPRWLKNCVVGRVSKKDLDDERMKETNSLDLMQNSSIIYHTESILEMQTMCLAVLIFLHHYWATPDKRDYPEPTNEGILVSPMVLMYVFLGEHIMVYIFGIFRTYDL